MNFQNLELQICHFPSPVPLQHISVGASSAYWVSKYEPTTFTKEKIRWRSKMWMPVGHQSVTCYFIWRSVGGRSPLTHWNLFPRVITPHTTFVLCTYNTPKESTELFQPDITSMVHNVKHDTVAVFYNILSSSERCYPNFATQADSNSAIKIIRAIR